MTVRAKTSPELSTGYGAVLLALDGVVLARPTGGGGARGLYPGTLAFLRRLRAGGIPTAVVGAGGGTRGALRDAGADLLIDVVVDADPADVGAGYRTAAERLGVPRSRCALVVSSVAHLRAGRGAGFARIVGVERGEAPGELEGADSVIRDLAELDLGISTTDPWILSYTGFDSAHEGHREALMVTGNGYVATRGALAERRDDGVHYPGTYVAGVDDRVEVVTEGRRLEEEHLVNLPDWLVFDLRIGDGAWWSSQPEGRALDERRELDLRRGVLTRKLTLDCAEGRLLVTQITFTSMRSPHLMVQETRLRPVGWSGTVTIRSGIDAGVVNNNTGVRSAHLGPPHFSATGQSLLCEVATLGSRIGVAIALQHEFAGSGAATDQGWHRAGRRQVLETTDSISPDRPLTVVKTAAIATSRDPATATASEAARAHLSAHRDVRHLRAQHERAWRRLWDLFHIELDADPQSRLILNLHVFQLLQAVSPHTPPDAGVPARGLHGEGYRGHVFWDELFVLPVIGSRLPDTATSLLDYRWARLGAARAAAAAEGRPGARYPWQSGCDGREETPTELFNPRSRRWMPDNSSRQRHVGLAVAYNAWQCYEWTGDRAWLAAKGGEMIIEVARHFAALTSYEPHLDRYHLDGVMGPDEYHDGYPGSPGSGLRDNAYTNVLTSWVCERALDVLDHLRGHLADDLVSRLDITAEERDLWSQVTRRIAVPFHDDGIISQFEGYASLLELDWPRYRERYGNIGRLDLILEAEGDTTNRYKLAKQADVLMLFYLLGPEALANRLGVLGYRADLSGTVDYYLARTAHGSSLSRVVHASVLAHFRPAESWSMFREALVADLDDTQGGTTREGIHLGAMAGSVDLVVRTFAGLRTHSGELRFTPHLPERMRSASFRLGYRGHLLEVALDHERLTVRSRPGRADPITIGLGLTTHRLEAGRELCLPLAAAADGSDGGRERS